MNSTVVNNRPGAWRAPILVLLVVALGGRYSLDRFGAEGLAWLDLRLVGLTLAGALLFFDLRRVRGARDEGPERAAEGWLVAAGLFLGYQAASGLWSPPGARVGPEILDLTCMALLTFAVYLHARQDPTAVARLVLWFFWAVAVVFAVGAFAVSGPGDQGRYAAFGGGPNVFVRVQLLGLIAGLALVAIGRTRGIAWSAPVLVLSALLSGSRGGLLAGAVVAFSLLLVLDRRARRFAFVASVASVALTVVAYELWPAARGLLQARFVGQTLQQGYLSDRPEIWGLTLSMAGENPLLGLGIGGFRADVGAAIGIDYPHNYLLAVAAEGGVVGITLLAASVALWLGTVRRARVWSVELIAMLASAAYVALASQFSGDYYDARLAWLFAALAAALAVAQRPGRDAVPPAHRAASPGRGERGRVPEAAR